MASRLALEVYNRDQLPQHQAMTQNNLRAALKDQGICTGGEAGRLLLGIALKAYQKALTIYIYEHLPTMTQNNLAKANFALQSWSEAADCYANFLKVYLAYEEIYQAADSLYQKVYFDFSKAFELIQQWLERQPDEIWALSDFAERNFT